MLRCWKSLESAKEATLVMSGLCARKGRFGVERSLRASLSFSMAMTEWFSSQSLCKEQGPVGELWKSHFDTTG